MKLFDSNSKEIAKTNAPFNIASLGQQTVKMNLKLPEKAGNYWLFTTAVKENGEKTLCRRKIKVVNNK